MKQHLTFQAEAMAFKRFSKRIEDGLLCLLRHPDAVVRVGAIMGAVTHFAKSYDLFHLVDFCSRHDPSPDVRAAAHNACQMGWTWLTMIDHPTPLRVEAFGKQGQPTLQLKHGSPTPGDTIE